MRVEIEKLDHTGNGIGYVDGKVSFIPKTIVGDVVDASIVKSSKKYNILKVNRIISKSENRIDSICPYYKICGGCNISNLSYNKQLDFKKNKVINIFQRYLDIDINPGIIGSYKQYKYRNKITFHVKDNRIGLVSDFGDIIEIPNCLLMSDKVNELYRVIRKEDLSKVKRITIKECDNGLILNIDGMMKINKLRDYTIEINLNGICVYHITDGYINIDNLKYKVSSKSFFQVNTNNISNLYNEIIKYGKFSGTEKVIDLYCGVGSISLYIAKYVKQVLGIEIIEDAIKDAQDNAFINNIKNVEFICSDVSKIDSNLINGDVLIVDPPRTGMDRTTIGLIDNSKIDKIIYVSCNPMTLVRDIKLLDNYEFKDISLVDMFPQTHHVECVSVLIHK